MTRCGSGCGPEPRGPPGRTRSAGPPLRRRQPVHLDPVLRTPGPRAIHPSIGSVGDAYDNALMECVNGLYKTECIAPASSRRALQDPRRRRVRHRRWVDWYNNRRLHGSLGMITPANTSRPITLPSAPRCSPHETGTKAVTLHTSRITGAAAREHVRVAALLEAHPEAADLLATGTVTWAHARIVATTLAAIDTLGTIDPATRARRRVPVRICPLVRSAGVRDRGPGLVETLTSTPDTDDAAEAAAVAREAAEKPADRFIQIFRDRTALLGRWKGLTRTPPPRSRRSCTTRARR